MATAVDASASGSVFAGQGEIQGAVLAAGAAAAGTLILYDNASAATGTVLLRLNAPTADSAVYSGPPIRFTNGVYAALTGTGAAAVVYL